MIMYQFLASSLFLCLYSSSPWFRVCFIWSRGEFIDWLETENVWTSKNILYLFVNNFINVIFVMSFERSFQMWNQPKRSDHLQSDVSRGMASHSWPKFVRGLCINSLLSTDRLRIQLSSCSWFLMGRSAILFHCCAGTLKTVQLYSLFSDNSSSLQ